ncbi:pseudouridine synthase [Peniophora sp. CONT]|nr:pseudouridine synthase [Peniophora sp. CONT]
MAPEEAQPWKPLPRAGLRKIQPYWFAYTTMAKERWLGREILEVVSTEFRDRSVEYYRHALESGVTSINGKVAGPDTIIRNGDRLENIVHRHEPPVTSTPVRVLLVDKEREFLVIDKPGSIPVHATGRFYYLSLVEILQRDFGFPKVYTVNRLDRLTSGLMILGLSSKRAAVLCDEFFKGSIKKEYIARCAGEFPEEETLVDKPLLTVDRQMGLNIVHPDGKPAQTLFKRLHYDPKTDTSVLHCRPLTGRSHQIRVHLQYLGHPIANDPVYSEEKIWGKNLGRGGIDTTPTDEREAPAPPAELMDGRELAQEAGPSTSMDPGATAPVIPDADGAVEVHGAAKKLLPRETGHDIGMGSPVPLSAEAVGIITRLRNQKDQDEDWSRWRDVVFKNKGKLVPKGIKHNALPPSNQRRRGGASADLPGPVDVVASPESEADASQPAQLSQDEALELLKSMPASAEAEEASRTAAPANAETEEGRKKQAAAQAVASEQNGGLLYCPECYLPLHPDPIPERLYIFLHALRYTTSLGTFETGMPEWAVEGFAWPGAVEQAEERRAHAHDPRRDAA